MLLKMFFKDIKVNKGRTFIILLCISFATALFLASISIIPTLMDSYKENSKVLYGNSDIVISSEAGSKTPFFQNVVLSEDLSKDIEYDIECPTINTFLKDKNILYQILTRGMTIADIKKINLLDISSVPEAEYRGNSVILSNGFADKYGYSTNDKINLEFNNQEITFNVCGIANSKSVYTSNAYNNQIFIPKDEIRKIIGLGDKTNLVFLKVKNIEQINAVKDKLSKVFREQRVELSFSEDEFNQKMQGIIIIFVLTTVVIIIMCFIIIYNTFKLILNERFRTLGILRGIGASRLTVRKMIFAEGFAYGLLGGALGVIIGILITYISGNILKPEYLRTTVFKINIVKIFISIIFTMIICSLAALSSARKIVKISIKNLILNVIKFQKSKERKILAAISFVVFTINIAFLFIVPSNIQMSFIIFSIIVTIFSAINILPLLVRGFLYIFGSVFRKAFKNIGYISLKNIIDSKSFYSNIILMTISIAIILMINSAMNSMESQNISLVRDNYKCDYIIKTNQNDKNIEEMVSKVKDVSDTYEQISAGDVKIVNKNNYSIFSVDGVDDRYFNFRNFNVDKDSISNIDSERYIILTNTIKNKLDIKKNDELILKIGNDEKKYKVKGFFDTALNNGNYALISNTYLMDDLNTNYYTELYVKTVHNREAFKELITNVLKKYNPKVQTVDDMISELFEEAKPTFVTIKIISWLPIIIGIIIIMGSSLTNFYERKRQIAIFRSLGMNKDDTRNMLFFEQFTSGVIGGLLGIGLGNLLIFQIKIFLNSIYNNMPINYSITQTIFMFLIEIVVYLLPLLIFMLKGLNFNIAKEIKLME